MAHCHHGPLLAGEIHELKVELGALDKSKKKDAVKKVIAAMTVGKDVSPLFPGGCCRQRAGRALALASDARSLWQ